MQQCEISMEKSTTVPYGANFPFSVCVQSYLLGSRSSLKTDSLGLDLSSTTRNDAGRLGTGREENINFLSDLSDDDDDDGDSASPQVTFF